MVDEPVTPFTAQASSSTQLSVFPSSSAASSLSSLCPPTKAMLAALTAVPSHMVIRGSKGKKGQGKTHVKAVSDSKPVSKVYNPQAGRPFPRVVNQMQQVTVTDELSVGFFTTSTGAIVYAALGINLSQFNNVTEYTALFDEYKFDQIEVWVDSGEVMSSSVGSTEFYTAIDLDDANTPTNVTQVSGKQGAVVSMTGTAHYHKWRPHVAVATYSGTFTSFGNAPSFWIDCASPAVAHFGLKASTNGFDGQIRVYNALIRAKISFRSPGI